MTDLVPPEPGEADRLLLLDLLQRSGALRFGEFRLKDGRASPYFLDFGRLNQGRDLSTLGLLFARKLQEQLPEGFDVVYGPAYKALPLAVATCQQLWDEFGVDRPYLTARKEAKGHGEGGVFLGPEPRGGERVVVVDDVMTSGGTKHEALAQVAAWSGGRARVVAVVVGVDREQGGAAEQFAAETGVPVLSLARAGQLFDHLRAAGGLDDDTWGRLEEYRGRG